MSYCRQKLFLLTLAFLLLLPVPAFAAETRSVYIDGQLTDYEALCRKNLVFLSARDLTSGFHSELNYDAEKKVVTITKGKTKAVLTIGSSTISVNDKKISLDASPMLVDSVAMLPAKTVTAIWGASVDWNEQAIYINSDGSKVVVPEPQKVFIEKTKVNISDKSTTVSCVRIPSSAGLSASLVLAQNSIGATEELSSLAQRSYAKAAINGSYFQNYDSSKSMDPYGILIKNGRLIHTETTGSAVGFTSDNQIKMGIVYGTIQANVHGTSFSISLMNHTPGKESSTVSFFTPARGDSIGFYYGTSIIVQNGEITDIVENKNAKIPSDGYVINFTGSEADFCKNLKKGDKVSYSITYVNESGSRVDWSDVQTGVGGGPLLLKNGSMILNPEREGFTDTTSFTLSTPRSALGVTSEGDILLVAGVKCTLEQLAEIMQQLGAENAICLDGGSSSGTYAMDNYVSAPSKEISNAIIFK